MTEQLFKIVLRNPKDGTYTQIRKDGKNAFTIKEAMEYVEEHEQSARESNTELEIEPLPNCLYVEDETTKTFLTHLYSIDFDSRYDYVIKEHPHLNIKWQAAPLFYYGGFECNEVDDDAVVLMYYDKHQINEVGCDKEIKFMDMDEFLASNPNVNNPTETIGDFVKKHTDKNSSYVSLYLPSEQYLFEKDSWLFKRLIKCTTIGLCASIDIDGDVIVRDALKKPYAGYSNDFPVTAVYLDLLSKMNKELNQCIKSIKEQFAKDKELRIWKSDYKTYKAISLFYEDYGIEINFGKENGEPYIDIIGIHE